MPISCSLSARLGPGRAPSPSPAAPRWSPYARPSDRRGSGCAKACRPPLRLEPATARILGPALKAPDVAAPTRRRLGDDKPSQKTDPKPAEANPEQIQEPRAQESLSCGGFVFLGALAGHTECVDIIKMGGKIGCMITHDKWVFFGITKSVEAWNVQTGAKLSLQGPSGLVCSMTMKDEMLFAGTGDGRIMVWKFPANESNLGPVAILSGHERQVISLSVSAKRLYSGSVDKTIRVWDLKTLQCVQTLSEHKAAVTSVLCWDQKLLSCSLDKSVKVWSVSQSGNLQVMHTHSEEHKIWVFGRGAAPDSDRRNGDSIRRRQQAANVWRGRR